MPGDTLFLAGEQVEKLDLERANEKVLKDGGQPATCQPLLLGITQSELEYR